MTKIISMIMSLIANLRSGLMLLKFPRDNENAFLHYYYKRAISQSRIALMSAIFLYGSVAFIDPYVVPAVLREASLIRFLIVIPIFVICLVMAYRMRDEIAIQITGSICTVVGCFGFVALMFINPELGSQVYQSGFMLSIVYGYACLRLRFGYASVVGWGCTIFYIVMSGFIRKEPFPVVINNSLFNIITNIIGMFVAYTLEANMRSEYLSAIAMKRTHKQLQKLSLFDDLTQIPNRRLFDMRLASDFTALKQTSQPLSLIIIDVDFFKDYNDYFGHQAGDHCLSRIAEKLQQFATKAGDLAARYGGEEFGIILSNASIIEARILAENIRQEVRKMKMAHPKSSIDSVVTLSLGVASIIPSTRNSVEHLIKAADDALYRAKQTGRNKVEVTEAV